MFPPVQVFGRVYVGLVFYLPKMFGTKFISETVLGVLLMGTTLSLISSINTSSCKAIERWLGFWKMTRILRWFLFNPFIFVLVKLGHYFFLISTFIIIDLRINFQVYYTTLQHYFSCNMCAWKNKRTKGFEWLVPLQSFFCNK